MITRDLFLSHTVAPEPVDVPGLGRVFVRAMSARERLAFEEAAKAPGRVLAPTLICFSACNDSGTLLFGPADVDALHDRPWKTLAPVYEKALELNRVTAADTETAAGELKTGQPS